jgi:hypothetical protein
MRQIKTPIAGNSQSIAKIGNAELAYFNKQMLIHELIRGSLATHCRLPAYVTDKECSLDSCRAQVRLDQARLAHTRLNQAMLQ